MANTTISPNMNLPVPTVGEDPGPDWATNYNACMTAIDSHNHSSGQGVSITPSGININADLPLNNSNLTTIKTLRFQPQVSIVAGASDIGCLQEVGVDLYYIDGAGNQIRITQSGSVTGSAGTITGLPSGTASASFAAGTFTFQAATNTPASMNVGPLKIGQAVASGFGVTISAAGSQTSNYGISLPVALPGATKILSLDASGNMGDSYDVDNSTLEIVSSTIQVKDGGITYPKLAALNIVTSAECVSFTTTSTSPFIDVTNLNVTITTSGRPVAIFFSGAAGDQSDINSSGGTGTAQIRIIRDGSTIISTNNVSTSLNDLSIPVGCLNSFDSPAAGTYSYKLQAKINVSLTSTPLIGVRGAVMSVYEL